MSAQQWYILINENQKGPYSYAQMIEMMQLGQLYDYHYIWSTGLEGWTMLAEVSDFSRDRLALLIQTKGPGSEGFNRREHVRAPVQLSLCGHNNETFFQGICTNLSQNGALLNLNSPFLLPSQEIVLHFRPQEKLLEPFKIRALIVRKHANRQVLHIKTGLEYAVRFLEIEQTGETLIKQILNNYKTNEQRLSS